MALISLKEYADRMGMKRDAVYGKYRRGRFQTAQKIGRDVMIDEDEPCPDARIKSGVYRDWRKNIETGKARREAAKAGEAQSEK